MPDPVMLAFGGSKRGRGRPAINRHPSDQLTPISAWVKARDYDNIVKLANASKMTVSAFVRTLIASQGE